MTTTLQLSDKTLAEIARNVAKYPPEQKQSAVMAALIEVGSPDTIASASNNLPGSISVRLLHRGGQGGHRWLVLKDTKATNSLKNFLFKRNPRWLNSSCNGRCA